MAQQHHDKVRVIIECSLDERAYIKMLAARKHMTISEYFLSFAREEMPHKPHKKTLQSMKELDEGGGTAYNSLDDFWKDMGVNFSANS